MLMQKCRGEIQSAKKIYESFLGNAVSVTALAHIQFIRFLRRTEGIEAARKYFLDTRKSPNCTYHVYVAYAMMAFCLDKDPKVAHNVFEAGLKRFMHEPGYILEYADFLCRLNDDRNIRALFERALSTLPPEESVEVWKRFTQFEQTYGDLASMLKVEQRKKEALSRTVEEGSSALEASLHDVVSRYSFMDLWPCSSADLDHLARQEWLLKNIDKEADKSTLPNGASSIGAEKGSAGLMNNSKTSMPSKVVYPDTSRMVIYDPRQKQVVGTGGLVGNATATVVSSTGVTAPPLPPHNVASSITSKRPLDEIMKLLPPSLVDFITHLPLVEGPSPNIDIVLSVLLQSNVGASPASEVSGSNKTPLPNLAANHSGKRKKFDRNEEDETFQSSSSRGALPRDAFMMRQIRKATTRPSQTGSTASGGTTGNTGSMISGELSGNSTS